MKKTNLTLGELLDGISSIFNAKGEDIAKHVGRKPQLSMAEVATIFFAFFLSRAKDFKALYFGFSGDVLRQFFPKLASYSALLRRLPKIGNALNELASSKKQSDFFIIASISFNPGAPEAASPYAPLARQLIGLVMRKSSPGG